MQFSIGRARPPLLREEWVSSKRQLAAERSLIARAFRQTRSLGVGLNYETDVLQVKTGFMDTSKGLFGDQSWRASTRLELRSPQLKSPPRVVRGRVILLVQNVTLLDLPRHLEPKPAISAGQEKPVVIARGETC